MSNMQTPEGMIPVEEFAKKKGMQTDRVINMIKDGFYVGHIVGEQWFVESETISETTSSSSHSNPSTSYSSEYKTARGVSKFISFLGWGVFGTGLISALILSSSTLSYQISGFAAALPGLVLAVSGLFLVAAGQVTRATVDNADHTREIMNMLREKN